MVGDVVFGVVVYLSSDGKMLEDISCISYSKIRGKLSNVSTCMYVCMKWQNQVLVAVFNTFVYNKQVAVQQRF